MSFLDHLDELRTRLMRVAAFVLVAFVLSWAFSDKIYGFLEVPVQAAMEEARLRGALPLATGPGPSVPLTELTDDTELTFTFSGDARLGDAFILNGTTIPVKVKRDEHGVPDLVTTNPWLINDQTIIPEGYVIPRHLYSVGSSRLSPDNRLVVQSVQGAFNLYIKVAFYAAIFFTVPFILIQGWGFIAPGLYPHEKKYAIPFIVMSTVCFVLGCAFAYYIAFPRAANFLLNVAAQGNLRPLVAADQYFDLILMIMLGLGVVFEIPTVTLFLSRLGLVTPQLLLRIWRIAVVGIFIVAALLSPTTDIPNLLVFAAPMLILYFLSVGIAWIFYRKRRKEGY